MPKPLALLLESAYEAGVRRYLIAVDTFERVPPFGSEAVRNVLALLTELSEEWFPEARLIIAGRASATEEFPGWATEQRQRPILLSFLKLPDARNLLKGLVKAQPEGISLSDEDCDAILDSVGTSPLSVRLAARLLASRGVQAFAAESERREFMAALREEKIEVFLFDRVLGHLNEKVSRIAYPGLIVRRITADIIRDVLAAPCKLELAATGSDSAEGSMQLLRGERAHRVRPCGRGRQRPRG
jgi:hypothetical protein